MWILRVWKIQQIEYVAAQQEKRPEDIDAASAEPVDNRAVSFAAKRSKSRLLKHLYTWTKV